MAAKPDIKAEPIQVTSLDDLDVVETEIEIRRPDGRLLRVPVRSLTQSGIHAIQKEVRWPKPPLTTIGGGKNGRPQIVKNYDDEKYKDALTEANREYGYRVLLRCLRLTIPGETEIEQLAAIQGRLGAWAETPISRALAAMHGVTSEDISEALKNSAASDGSN